MFGDGAGAVVLKAEENAVYIQAVHSIGSREPYLCQPQSAAIYKKKDRRYFFKHTCRWMEKKYSNLQFPKFRSDYGGAGKKQENQKEEIRFYMLHQANKRIVASVSKHMNEPLEKYPMNIENLGNTSSTSIPLLLDEWNKKAD